MADIAKVKRNIQSMIDQKAPESDIDMYLQSEGVSIDQLKMVNSAITEKSNIDQPPWWYEQAIKPTIELGGMMAGEALGTLAGPMGTVAGAGAGYATGKRLTTALDVGL